MRLNNFRKYYLCLERRSNYSLYTDSQATLEKFKALGGETKEVIYPGIGHIDFPSVLETQSDGQTGVVDEIKTWISKIRRPDV